MKVVFIGAARSGKTTIILNMLYGICNQKYKATIEDHFKFCAKLPDGKIQVLDIVDTSGTDEFPVKRDLRIRQGEVFVVVYAVDSRESFQYAVRMCQKIKAIKDNERAPIILVGNKTDMSSERSVTYEEGYQFLLSWETCFFIETSARLGDHIERMLHLLTMRGDPSQDIYNMRNRPSFLDQENYVHDRSVSIVSNSDHNLQKRKKTKRRCSVL